MRSTSQNLKIALNSGSFLNSENATTPEGVGVTQSNLTELLPERVLKKMGMEHLSDF